MKMLGLELMKLLPLLLLFGGLFKVLEDVNQVFDEMPM